MAAPDELVVLVCDCGQVALPIVTGDLEPGAVICAGMAIVAPHPPRPMALRRYRALPSVAQPDTARREATQ